MNKKVILIRTLNELTNSSMTSGPRRPEQLSLSYLASSLEDAGFETIILSGDVSKSDLFQCIDKNEPFAVCFSIYTYTCNASLFLARQAKARSGKKYPLITVFGGYHASTLPEEIAAKKEVDFVVKGEGDITLKELLTTLYEKKDPVDIPGLCFRKNGKILHTSKRERIINIDNILFPKRQKINIDIPKRLELAYPAPSKQVCAAHIIYSRGCPFSCSFCDSKFTWDKKIFFRSPVSVLDEIEMLVKKFNTNLLIFLDLTFNANRQKVLSLCNEFQKRNLQVHWTAMVRADLLDEETLSAMAFAKCSKIHLGIESPKAACATEVKDSYETNNTRLLAMLKYASSLGMILRAFLMIGFPNENEEKIKSYMKDLYKYPIDELRVTIATPFPGTSLWDECKRKKLLPLKPKWDDFTTEKLVFKHPYFTNNSIKKLQKKIVKDYFLSDSYKKHVQDKLSKFPYLRESWIEFFQFLLDYENDIFKNNKKQLITFIDNIKNLKI